MLTICVGWVSTCDADLMHNPTVCSFNAAISSSFYSYYWYTANVLTGYYAYYM